MSAQFTDTRLTLGESNDVPTDVMMVPNLIGPGRDDKPFYTTAEPMVFRVKGSDQEGVQLKVVANRAVKGVEVASVTALGAALGAPIEARRLTKGERIKQFTKSEVILAVMAVLLALCTAVTVFWAPSADEKMGRAEFARQLQPIEQQLTVGLTTHDDAAVQRAHSALAKAVAEQPHSSNILSAIAQYGSLVLGVLSALFALGVTIKHARSSP